MNTILHPAFGQPRDMHLVRVESRDGHPFFHVIDGDARVMAPAHWFRQPDIRPHDYAEIVESRERFADAIPAERSIPAERPADLRSALFA